jgi:hypothetical protein
MIHLMEDEWQIQGIGRSQIITANLYPFIKYKKMNPVELHIDEFAHKPLDTIEIDHPRYKLADVIYPLFAVDGMPNPYNKKYRMIDGRHRLLKQINSGKSVFLFYVFDYHTIKHYIHRC